MTPERERHREIITVHVPIVLYISDCDPLVGHSAHCSREMMYMSVNPQSNNNNSNKQNNNKDIAVFKMLYWCY